MLKNKRRNLYFVSFMLILCVILSACQKKEYQDINAAIADNAKIGENVFIDDVEVSGLSVQETLDALKRKHTKELKEMSITVKTDSKKVNVTGDKLPVTFADEEIVLEALKLSKYCPGNNSEGRQLYTNKIVDEKELEKVLSVLTAPLNKGSLDAQASYDKSAEGSFSYTEEQCGECVDLVDAAKQLSACINEGRNEIQAKMKAVNPKYTLSDAQNDNMLISEFTTSFAGETYSRANRVHNIQKAASLIDGVRLDVDEEFDMNKILGDRNRANGWKEATGIRDGKYVEEYGGGVCQVSTTLYNAVLMADLEVTDRSHHSWPLGYIDVGRDATISTGGPNFKFKNNSDVPITVSAITDTEKKAVTVRIYGRKSKEFASITLTSKKTGTLDDLGDEIVVDKSLPSGKKEVEREKRIGVVAKTYKEYRDEKGQIIRKEEVTTDKYRSVKGLIRVASDVNDDAVATSTTQYEEGSTLHEWSDYFSNFEE